MKALDDFDNDHRVIATAALEGSACAGRRSNWHCIRPLRRQKQSRDPTFVDDLQLYTIIGLAATVVAMYGSNVLIDADLNLVIAIAIRLMSKAVRAILVVARSVFDMPNVDVALANGFSNMCIMVNDIGTNVTVSYQLVLALIYRAGHLLGSIADFPRTWSHQTDAGFGFAVIQGFLRFLPRGAVDDFFSRKCNLLVGVRLQSSPRFVTRLA